MKKVLFVASIQKHIELFHLPFIESLQELGYEVHAAAKLEESQYLNGHKGKIYWHNIDFSRSPFSLSVFRAYKQLHELMKRQKYCLVHTHTPVASFIGRLAALSTGTRPVLYTAHGFHFYKGAPLSNWALYLPAELLAARWTDGLITMNAEDYHNANKLLGFVPEETAFLINGVGLDVVNFQSAGSQYVRNELGIPKGDTVIVCVAEFTPNKNHRVLLKAWELISSQNDQAHLLLVGNGALFQSLAQSTLLPRTYFLGFRADVPQILNESDIAVLVSKREGLPKCIMEAMAAGLPTVGTNIRGIRELVENGQNGILVNLDDVDALAVSLLKLINDNTLRCKLANAARVKIVDYSLEKVIPQMQKIYKRFLPTLN